MAGHALGALAGYAFDLDGTVYLDEHLIPGADRVIASLRAAGARVVFVTNKPLQTAASYAEKLTRLGIPSTEHDVVTAVDSLLIYLARHHPGARVLTIAEDVVDQALAGAGFTVTTDPLEADVVAVSFDRSFDYSKLTRAYHAVRRGAVIVATNPDPYCPTADGGLPDCAAMLAALEACTGVRAIAVLGKPSPYMAEAFLDRLGVSPGEAVIVGDRPLTDIAMGAAAGMHSVLVLSGATNAAEAASSPVQADLVLDDLNGLFAPQPA
jgi:HAD superfamily hydrolase (TIGR01450 family)